MNRRNFFRNATLSTAGAMLLNPIETLGFNFEDRKLNSKAAKNIIMLVSDGMSTGTLNMADMYLSRKTGIGSNWLQLYRDNKVSRALMDMASASSIVTDSAAASSSWGGGVRIPNGSINVSTNGEEHMPLWQKFMAAGKKAGCVTTVPITHATPAGFCVNQKSRNDQERIAEKYVDLKLDVLLGGGSKYFDANTRKDKRNMFEVYEQQGYYVAQNREKLLGAPSDKRLLGVFAENGLPYAKDRYSSSQLTNSTPSIAEMIAVAITNLKGSAEGFVLMVEGGKVDWAAHANDITALIYDQVAFDEAVKEAIDFAEEDGETLVIITTDHGNANPGVIYGAKANEHFDGIQKFTQTNEWILNGVDKNTTINQLKERIQYANGVGLSDADVSHLLSYYKEDIPQESGLYNPKKLPFRVLAEIQKGYTSVGWISMNHSADYVELAMYGPGSELVPPFVKNTDLHYLMLTAAEVENKF
ncbi:alkaline phosphatase [Neptunitalea chrysea]|uniref:Alkaline phosphatase n=1 Tax=Neptunitalea chrysea TaxID=1647581 RepID=A0A9W6EW18_9FLAO|nr:alkaline phosphatase [Neptunitalea chrysea]GLB53661.1 alkaline phosphatase [Neptunitalea chrysea]